MGEHHRSRDRPGPAVHVCGHACLSHRWTGGRLGRIGPTWGDSHHGPSRGRPVVDDSARRSGPRHRLHSGGGHLGGRLDGRGASLSSGRNVRCRRSTVDSCGRRRLVRVDLRLYGYRLNRLRQPQSDRRPGCRDPALPTTHAMGRGHGHRGPCGNRPAVPASQRPRPDRRRGSRHGSGPAGPAGAGHGDSLLASLSGTHRAHRRRLPGGRHGPVRCRGPRPHHRLDRRLFDPGRIDRTLGQRGRGVRPNRCPDPRSGQLHAPQPFVEPEADHPLR